MAWKDNNADCARTCWSIAAVAGFIAAVLLYWVTDIAAIAAILVGILIGVGVGFGLRMFICKTGVADVQASAAQTTDTAVVTPSSAVKAAPNAVTAQIGDPSAPIADVAEPQAEGGVAAAAVSSQDRPAMLRTVARPEGKDDLKLISGVGPKLEQTLNDLGIFHFDQIAKFDTQDIEWVDARVRFKGRIIRDDWMSQAGALAKGEEIEISKKKKKN